MTMTNDTGGTKNKYYAGMDEEAVDFIKTYAEQRALSQGRALSEIIEIFAQGEMAAVTGETQRALAAAQDEFEKKWGRRIKRVSYIDFNLQVLMYEMNAVIDNLGIERLPDGHSIVWDQADQAVRTEIAKNKEKKDNAR